MSVLSKKQITLFFSLCLILVCSQISFAGDPKWREVSASELSMTKPTVDADADAEAIFWEVHIDDSNPSKLTMNHYVRVKIFTELGRENFSKVDIPFYKGKKIKNIAARVIRPDGTITNLQEADIFEREIVKSNDAKVKAKSFAVPNIGIGVILEYQYEESISSGLAHNIPLIFQREIPIQDSTFYVKPSRTIGVGMKWLGFNLEDMKFVEEKKGENKGFHKATMKNVPAVKEESRMPPEDQIRSWGIIYYDFYTSRKSNGFWSDFGGILVSIHDIKDVLKTSKDEKNLAEEITKGASTPQEKVKRIFDYCRTNIKNITYDPKLTEEELDEIKTNKSPKDTLKKQQGRANEINSLFAALVSTLDLETRLVFTGDKRKIFFSRQHAHPSFVHAAAVAVEIDNKWKYFDPGTPFVPYGMMAWFEEDQIGFLLDNDTYKEMKTPLSTYDQSLEKRTGKFTLLEDGTLEGTVEMEYTGHFAFNYKVNNYEDSQNQREETLKERIKTRISTAEVSDISVENVDDTVKPFVYKYKVRIPNYAQKTGKRIFFQPGFFEYGTNPEFSTNTRKYGIFFKFAWSELDQIEIKLPEGYALDSPEIPADISDPQKIGLLQTNVEFVKDTNTIRYKRKFHFGGGGNYLFQPEAYTAVKGLFDAFHKANTFSLTLKSQ